MGLVDYSSDDAAAAADDDDGDDDSAGGATQTPSAASAPPRPALPPLPRAFHDLYAATVRRAPADDPSLHQGRRRAIPHVAGQWPSHVYIEWIPSASEHARLVHLLAALGRALGDGVVAGTAGTAGATAGGPAALHSLLTSELGAPLPLHISLSRPFVLATADRAGFRAGLAAAVAASGVGPFGVTLQGLDWFRSPDAARAFLVLRAAVPAEAARPGPRPRPRPRPSGRPNQPLVALLGRCNDQVTAAGQPALYAPRADDDDDSPASSFHVSVAWTLAAAADLAAWARPTQEVYSRWREQTADDAPLRIPVDSLKVKIGNVVTDVPLAAADGRHAAKRPRSSKDAAGATSVDDGSPPRGAKRSLRRRSRGGDDADA